VCASDGTVFDILPGIYTPAVFVHRLNQFRLLANYVDLMGKQKREERLEAYHIRQAQALAKREPPLQFVDAGAVTKRSIERGVKAILLSGEEAAKWNPPADRSVETTERVNVEPRVDLASWKLLLEDTRQNETIRRRQVHEMLAATGLVKPNGVVKRLYKEVLHADIDDPYLGLGPMLFAGYPFKDGEPHAR